MRYDATDIAQRYDAARQLPEATVQLWVDAITEDVPPLEVRTVVVPPS